MAKKYHPDANKDDPTAAKKFQEVSEAYECLSDPQKRQQYDSLGKSGYKERDFLNFLGVLLALIYSLKYNLSCSLFRRKTYSSVRVISMYKSGKSRKNSTTQPKFYYFLNNSTKSYLLE